MTKTPLEDVAAPVRTRLLQYVCAEGDGFQQVLTRYANERLLYRLAASSHTGHLIVNGATPFMLWTGRPRRATRDLDLLPP